MGRKVVIDKLTTREKIQLMEELWADLGNQYSANIPPDWHANELEKREQLVQEGKENYSDWEQVKKEIRKQTT